MTPNDPLQNIRLEGDGDAVIILDQTLLPGQEVYLRLTELSEMVEAIASLRVRGAPALGVFGGYALYVLARTFAGQPDFKDRLQHCRDALFRSRPTAVNLGWALDRMMTAAQNDDPLSAMGRECRAIHEEDMDMCRRISEYGLSLLHDGFGVLTHCNAGPLATSRYGTGQGPLFLAQERGMKLRVFADETRPLLQGARLTAFELERAGADVTLICDNMAATVMARGWVDACMVGCDRVAANGDTANKIGTSGVAILAHHFGIPFYVLGPTSTIDLNCKTGADIPIELRDPEELRSKFYEKPMTPASVKCFNPAFDVTDHSLITAIITEAGICYPPFTDSLALAKAGKNPASPA